MKISKNVLIGLLMIMACMPSKPQKQIPIELLEEISLDLIAPNLDFEVDSTSEFIHQMLIDNNRWEHLKELEIELLFEPDDNGLNNSNKYYQVQWENSEYNLILAAIPAYFTYLLIVSREGVIHDGLKATHYMPGPVCCDYDRRKLKQLEPGKFEFEWIYGVSIDETDSCEKVVNIDEFKINEMAYFEHLNRISTFEKKLKKCQ